MLLKESPENFTLKKAIDALDEMTAKNYGLPASADKDVMFTQSRSVTILILHYEWYDC